MDNPVLTPEQQAVEDAAVQRVQQGLEVANEQVTGETDRIPEGFNDDGTPIEDNLIGGKFKSNDDLLQAYQELEKKLGQPKEAEAPQETPKVEQEASKVEQEASKVEQEVPKEAEGTLSTDDFKGYYEEFTTNGGLSEDAYKALEAKGLSKDVVDNYIAGQQALQTTALQEVQALVGGADEYTSLITWAKETLTDAQKEDFNAKVTSGNGDTVKDAVEYLMYQKNKVAPQETVRLQGQSYSGPTGGVKAFSDRGEHNQAVANRLYGRDAAYTNMVDKRFLASRKAGTL